MMVSARILCFNCSCDGCSIFKRSEFIFSINYSLLKPKGVFKNLLKITI